MDVQILTRRGVPEVLATLSEKKPATSGELVEKTSISKTTLPVLREEGLVEVSVKGFVEEVPVRGKRPTYELAQTGRRMMELHDALSETGGSDLLQITPRQLECMSPLREGRKTFKDIPRAEYTVLNRLARKGLIDKRVAEVEETRRLRRSKPVYALTKRGERAYEACRIIESLWHLEES